MRRAAPASQAQAVWGETTEVALAGSPGAVGVQGTAAEGKDMVKDALRPCKHSSLATS